MTKSVKFSLTLGSLLFAGAAAAAYPSKPIELVVPFPPGGGSDVSARVFAQCLEKQLSEKVLVKNIKGARGKIGEVEVRDSRPDGYTLLWAHQGMDMAKPTGRSDYNYTAFKPVASSVVMNYGIFAGKNSGLNSVDALKQSVKKNPGGSTIGIATQGFSHFAALDFLDAAGIEAKDVRAVAMSGDKPRIVASMQGNLTLVPTAVGAAASYVESGDMVTVAILSPTRDSRLKNAKTAKEQGVDSLFAMHFTTFAPKNTPDAVINTLAKAWLAAAKDQECIAKLEKQSMAVEAMAGAELDLALAKRYARIEQLAKKFELTAPPKK